MPNWCQNILDIAGPEHVVSKIIEMVKPESDPANSELSLAKMVPPPPDIGEGWYDWNINNWGTKWDVDAQVTSRDNGFVTYSFDSAWSPPVEAIEKFASKFSDVTFTLKYCEGGGDFGGVFSVEPNGLGGHIVNSEDMSFYDAYEFMYGEPPEGYEDEEDDEEEEIVYGQEEGKEETNAGNDIPTE